MASFLTHLATLSALGPTNVGRVTAYRLGIKLRIAPVVKLKAESAIGPFFAREPLRPAPAPALRSWVNEGLLFSRHTVRIDDQPPDWFANPLSGACISGADRPWFTIPDFDPAVGDIKLIWEFSRFDWVLALAQKARTGSAAALDRLNCWIGDWCEKNPPYRGPNWKCGQEASIRVMHLAMAARILDAVHSPRPGLRKLITQHLQRIRPTVAYACAQDNNHGISEAAALFIGGSWLNRLGDGRGARWMHKGRTLLEERVARLVAPDGGFSQYSVNYHRVMLDTLSMAEIWRRDMRGAALSATFLARVRVAAEWLRRLTDPTAGDAPVAGANDGARLLQLANADYRDHRPSVQLATALFCDRRAYEGPGPHADTLAWLDIPVGKKACNPPTSDAGTYTGFTVLRCDHAMALLRCPRFRFRPSQADALHVDLWLDGENVLRDGGSYSYNADPPLIDYFGGVSGHNTIQFDNRDQMPRLGRFLFGDWLATHEFSAPRDFEGAVSAMASYRDRRGIYHKRSLSLQSKGLAVTDEISGFRRAAVLRWRLKPGAWRLEGNTARLCQDYLRVSSATPPIRTQIVEGLESRYYYEKTSCPVFEAEFDRPTTIISEYGRTR